ncbi:DEAD/DEAH box helicase [Ornithinimicrobium sp. CNJ-824]|uniref:DEAD/DEAH box helicase n=1 Tax=Ornithinimicrobium sp. CNJ-824 TaxID=1904966 RepID=UPI00096A9BE7|nr:DEAD/DEAH box helicase [Ornithinimicrobium sp. CNJ-824]
MALEDRTLRSWQREAMNLWTANNRGVVSVVTGGGKTVFALACASHFLAKRPAGRVLVLVPSLALQQQWMSAIAQTLHRVVTPLSGHNDPPTGSFTVAVVNSMRSRERWSQFDQGEWMLIADECHRYGSQVNSQALRGSWLATVGLSATPYRQFDSGFQDLVSPVLGPVIYEYSYREALRDGVLSPFELHNVRIPLTAEEEDEHERLTRRVGRLIAMDAPEEQIRMTLLRRARYLQKARFRIPATVAVLNDSRSERSIVFHEATAAADEIHRLLQQAGHRTVRYHSKIGVAERLRSLRMFESGQADVLVTCRALDEGYDVPDVTLGLISASTSSIRQRIQRLGRVLRRAPGKDQARVVTIYASDSEAERLRAEAVDMSGLADTRWFEVQTS